MTVRAVLFDLGETLIFEAHPPSEEQVFGAMADALRPLFDRWGIAGHLDVIAFLGDLHAALDVAQRERRARGYEVDAPFVARAALAAHGVDVSEAKSAEVWRATAIGLPARGWQLYPDTLDTLRRVRALAIPAALVSNSRYGSDARRPLLAELGITEELLDPFVFSPDLMRPKPRPEPFLRALDALSVAPADALFVGDELEEDIRGAKALGMTTVWKLNGRHDVPPAEEADFTVHDLWEIFDLGILTHPAAAPVLEESLTPHDDRNADRY